MAIIKMQSRVRAMTLLDPNMEGGRPVSGKVKTSNGLRWWSLDNGEESLRKNQSDLYPLYTWKALRDDWVEEPA